MNTQQTLVRALCGLIAAMVIRSGTVSAAESPTAPPEPSREARAKLASAHERMYTRFRSAKSIADCRSEMMKSGPEIMDEQGCPMAGMGMHQPRMPDPGSTPPKANQA
jgi:hypothetical protein